MRLGLLALMVGCASAIGCGSSSARPEQGTETIQGLKILVATVFLNNPKVEQRIGLLDVSELPTCIGNMVGRSSGNSEEVRSDWFLTRISDRSIKVEVLVQFGDKEREYTEECELSLEPGRQRIILLPSEGDPKCLFLIACVRDKARGKE